MSTKIIILFDRIIPNLIYGNLYIIQNSSQEKNNAIASKILSIIMLILIMEVEYLKLRNRSSISQRLNELEKRLNVTLSSWKVC